jgi:hypothetical protein
MGIIALVVSGGVIEDNVISAGGGGAGDLAVGIGMLTVGPAPSPVSIQRNRVLIASTMEDTIGVTVSGSQPTIVANNVVMVNGPEVARGIGASSDSFAKIVNNTIVTHGGGVACNGVILQTGGHPDIANNLLVNSGATACIGINEFDVASDPLSVIHNVLVGYATPYRDEGASSVTDISSLTGQPIACSACGSTKAVGNVTLAATDPFVLLAGADSDLDTDDNDAHLATSDIPITAGGVATTTAACGSVETPHDCGAVTSDRDGVARTVPPSVGAYEKD